METTENKKKSSAEELKKETLPSISSKSKSSSIGKRPTWKQLQTAYASYPPVFRAINIRANEIMARGYQLISNNEQARKDVCDWWKLINFDTKLHVTIINTYVFGDGYEEIVFDQTDMTDLALIHPGTIDYTRTSTGDIIFDKETGYPKSYTQEVGLEKKEGIDPKTIFHLTFNKVADEWKGISIIEPMYKTILRTMNIDEGMAQAIWRFGFPFIHQKIGSETKTPTREEIDKGAKEIRGLNTKSDITTPWYYDIKVVEAAEMKGVEKYTDPFINLICSGTGVPKFLLMGTGEGTNKATSQEHSRHFRYSIEADQRIIKEAIEDQIIVPFLENRGYNVERDMVYLEWNELTPEVDEAKVASVVNLFETGIITKEEAREMLKLVAEMPSDVTPQPEEPKVEPKKPKTEGGDEDSDVGDGTEPSDTEVRESPKA